MRPIIRSYSQVLSFCVGLSERAFRSPNLAGLLSEMRLPLNLEWRCFQRLEVYSELERYSNHGKHPHSWTKMLLVELVQGTVERDTLNFSWGLRSARAISRLCLHPQLR